ncbi:MAG TPA: two-component regulator propeller domain-containing protein, partial [Bacteroidia bacterium]|nr:two-component regulator propeller domain-containing protein [Bacteroidia bacterium]
LPSPGYIVTKLLITRTGAKWMLFPGAGILAYQDNGTFVAPSATNTTFITNVPNYGALPSLNIYCMTEDLNGAIWIGTDAQVVVFYSPDNIFNGPGGWDAQNVYVQQTGYTQYLMQNQYSTCIAVDGANRKWIGTLGGGVFLMSADGTQQILNFTSSNSPLLSNNILSLTIDQTNGEVFFGTDQGLISYRGSATEGNATFSNVYAYPDPVPHNYTGPIAIKNLVSNSDVKIASVNGEIVYHTVAQGGQAIWNGDNFNGVRVQTGVYLVFCTSPDGTQSLVTKLLLEN